MSIGSFILTKNEAPWIAAHILRVLPYIDEMVFFDGNSTDGTLEIIEAIKANEKGGEKIKLFKDKDPKNLQDDYVRLFDECMRSLSTDLAWFLHPDMVPLNPKQILLVKDSPAVALSTAMRSFAGEPGGKLYEIVSGRGPEWKNIHRLRNPDLGAHYYGHYGEANEDVYFKAITGDKHELYEYLHSYPFVVQRSGIECLHFSDVRPLARRVDRMKKCLLNNGWSEEEADARSKTHPRVTLKDGEYFKFVPTEWPIELIEARNKYRHLERSIALV